jgi:hypothetical protein
VLTKGSIAAIHAIDPDTTRSIFAGPTSIALGGWPGSVTGWAWPSCAQFFSDLTSGAVPTDVRAVMYDPEAWEATPIEERRDPIRFIRRFARLGRRSGYFVIVTPHPGLVEVPGSTITRAADESREDACLRSGITSDAAREADACEIQAQRFQRDPAAYRDVVFRAANQAREANPDVIVLSGLSTHPGYRATSEMLCAAWDSVRDIVDGHYLSLARFRHPRAAASFLRVAVEAGASG